jgi:hypothetical protein
MSESMLTTLTTWQDELLDLVERVQEPMVRFAGETAESLAEYVPQAPAWPFLAQLPTVSALVENQIAFATKVVDQQAGFARSMVKAAQPVLSVLEIKKPAPRRTTRKAAAPAAAKAA